MSELIEKYLTQKDRETIESYQEALESENILVTCMGLYNHGKSSLLNALTKSIEEETFKTADVRETSENKALEYEDITYVDTPGLNAQEYDDKRVMDAVKESDMNLFVHKVTTGEFTEVEIKFLENVKKHWENPMIFLERTIFVISQMDEAQSEEDVQNTITKMKQQLMTIFEIKKGNVFSNMFGKKQPFEMIAVSSKRYLDGKRNNKELLVKRSNINLLEEIISTLVHRYKEEILETKRVRLVDKYQSLIDMLDAKENKIRLELNNKQRAFSEYKEALEVDVKKTEETLKNMYAELNNKGTALFGINALVASSLFS